MSTALFMREAGIQMTVVPYRGANPAIQDLLGGRVDCFANNLTPRIPLHQSKKVRILALTTSWRSPQTPDIPTFIESGVPTVDVPGWYSFFVPAKTPPAIVQRMTADTRKV